MICANHDDVDDDGIGRAITRVLCSAVCSRPFRIDVTLRLASVSHGTNRDKTVDMRQSAGIMVKVKWVLST